MYPYYIYIYTYLPINYYWSGVTWNLLLQDRVRHVVARNFIISLLARAHTHNNILYMNWINDVVVGTHACEPCCRSRTLRAGDDIFASILSQRSYNNIIYETLSGNKFETTCISCSRDMIRAYNITIYYIAAWRKFANISLCMINKRQCLCVSARG